MPYTLPFAQDEQNKQGDPLAALIASLLAPPKAQTQPTGGFDLSGLLKSLYAAKDPVGYANKMTAMPSYAPGSLSPFNTGFFKTNDERKQIAANRFPGY